MLRKILKGTGLAIALLIVVGAVLYALGLRMVLHGSGMPYLAFMRSESAQAARIAAHRESQRAKHEARPARAPADGAAYWTDFRGPNRDGHYREQSILTKWPAGGPKPEWKQPIGGGYASFVVAHGKAFTIEQRDDDEVVAAYDVATGRELWTNRWSAAFRESQGGDGPRATPTWHEGRVYALGATGELRCLEEADGRVVWRTNILSDARADNLTWGMAAAPLVVDDTIVVLPGGKNGQSVVAYDARTGRRRWSALDDKQGYSSPMLVTLAGVRQILVFSASRLMGLSPKEGDVLWEHPWTTPFDVNASQPIVIGENRVFVSTGYGTGAAVIEIAPRGDRRFAVREVWRNIRMKNRFTSSVLHEGFIYGLDEAILACVSADTGKLMWKGGRYGHGQLMLADGHLIVLTEDGDLALVRATPERHEEIVRFPVLDGKAWNHPAMSDGYLLVRNLAEMAA
ncbi:MAG: PQQ-binding-like beta-propeller repeat protein, partial [Vicinamibacteraceae bacterium]